MGGAIAVARVCTACLKVLPLGCFTAHPLGRLGRVSQCRECKKAYNKAWREQHPGYARDWKVANPERHRANKRTSERSRWLRRGDELRARQRDRLYAAYHAPGGRERHRERERRWRDAHPETSRLRVRHKRARRRASPGTHSLSQWLARVETFGWKCWRCHITLTSATLAADHVIPISRGGTNWASNLRPICKTCNSSKGAKLPCEL